MQNPQALLSICSASFREPWADGNHEVEIYTDTFFVAEAAWSVLPFLLLALFFSFSIKAQHQDNVRLALQPTHSDPE
jgi:hypothetical protein